MPDMSVVDGVIVGAVGGTFAGVTVWLVQLAHTRVEEWMDKRRVYQWLLDNTSNEVGNEYRSTRAIASWNNLTEDRVRYICSIHERIYLSTGTETDMWSLYERGDRSVYEKQGLDII